MKFDLDQAMAVLERTPRLLTAWLSGLPQEWTSCTEGEGSWSAYDILGHLIHGERTDWLPRLRIILQYGAARAFDPFDRTTMFTVSQGKSMDELLMEFTAMRASNLEALGALEIQPEQFNLPGLHPALGSVTLSQLLATWTAHDLSHIHQIARVMTRQYRDAVGPWREYISLLRE
jgi:hypothetical protein